VGAARDLEMQPLRQARLREPPQRWVNGWQMAPELRRLLADGIDGVDKTKILATEREFWKDATSRSFLRRTLADLDAYHILVFLFSFLPEKR